MLAMKNRERRETKRKKSGEERKKKKKEKEKWRVMSKVAVGGSLNVCVFTRLPS